MKKRNIWVATGALGVMALGIGAAVADGSQTTTDLDSSVTQTNDRGAQRTQSIAPLELPDSVNTSIDTARRTALPVPTPAPVQGNSGWTAASAPSAATVPAPVPLPAPVPAPAAPAPVQGDSGWTAASDASAGSAVSTISAASGD